jgi:hypothetical protein
VEIAVPTGNYGRDLTWQGTKTLVVPTILFSTVRNVCHEPTIDT